ncbi:MAG: sensor histidine kinase [Candidatus Electrothrix sp. ATG1]|nr:sensor histidine kinase [Candidatus Electrothrix sp. ATG1]
MDTATILYDPFGRVVQVNEQMMTLMREEDIRPFASTALDLIVRLTGRPMDEVRQLLNYVIINKKNIHLPANQLDPDKKSSILVIHPLLRNMEIAREIEAVPFHLLGILVELVEMSSSQSGHQLKEELLEKTNIHLRQELEVMFTACVLLKQDDLQTEARKKVVSLLEERSRKMQNSVDELDEFFSKNLFLDTLKKFPVNPENILRETVQHLEPEARKNRIDLVVTVPQHVELICVGPDELRELLEAILTILIRDGIPKTSVSASISIQETTITYTMISSGYGIPNDTFQQYIFTDNVSRSDEYRIIHSALPALKKWNAALSGESSMGGGIRFDLVLQIFR